MKKLLSLAALMVTAVLSSYAPSANADYLVRMDAEANLDWMRNYHGPFGEIWGWTGCYPNQSTKLPCQFVFSGDYRDSSALYAVSIMPRNDIYANCFKEGSVWQIDLMDTSRTPYTVLDSYTHQFVSPTQMGALYFISPSTMSRVRTFDFFGRNFVALGVHITPKAGTRSPLPVQCIHPVTLYMVLPEWTYEWLGHYYYQRCSGNGCWETVWVQ